MLSIELVSTPTGCTAPTHRQMTARVVAAVDADRYPFLTACMHCGSRKGQEEEVWVGDAGEDDKSGFAVRFTCRRCSDAGLPSNTFHPIRLKPGTPALY